MQFDFNGTTSDELGLILPKTIFRPSWAEETEVIQIPGRPEVIRQATGIYSNQAITIPAAITDMGKVRDIYSKLQGEGALVLSTAPNEYMNARAEVITPEAVALDMAEIDITFDCFPFAYATNPTKVEFGTSYTLLNNQSTVYSSPIFEFKIAQNLHPILKGDVNFDGKINSVDASMVLAEIGRIKRGEDPTFTPEQFQAADMDEDGVLTVDDANEILRIYALKQTNGSKAETAAQNIELIVNGASLIIGVPNEVLTGGLTITVDCGLHIIYYTDLTGEAVNITQYSSLDLPLLHGGENWVKYSGNNVEKATAIINERWV